MDAIWDFPDEMDFVLRSLQAERSVLEVWLIGSRVNGALHAASDWDLFVIADSQTTRDSPRAAGVDVLWQDPSGTVVLEGHHTAYEFLSFEWTVTGDGTAQYIGKSSKHRVDGEIYDTDEPFFRSPRERAIRLWHR
jgi:predicted nucleotidyltransferase